MPGGINSSKSYGLYAENLLILRFCAENDIAVLHQRLHQGAKAMAASALDLYLRPELVAELKKTKYPL